MTDGSEASRLVWRKSSRSGGGQECVEVAGLPNTIAVRDSKDLGGPALLFSASAWRGFNLAVQAGDHDLHG